MKQKQTVLIMFFLICINLLAQDNNPYQKTFADYTSYISKKIGVTCKMPENFIDLNMYFKLFVIQKSPHCGSFYGPILQSKNKECILMYPSTVENNLELNKPSDTRNKIYPRTQIIYELEATYCLLDSFGIHLKDNAKSIEFNKYVTVIGGDKAREMFNVDSIYFYEIPLDQPYQNKYTYCKGMVLNNPKGAAMIFKWFFSENGKKKESEYINQLSKLIWYDDK